MSNVHIVPRWVGTNNFSSLISKQTNKNLKFSFTPANDLIESLKEGGYISFPIILSYAFHLGPNLEVKYGMCNLAKGLPEIVIG